MRLLDPPAVARSSRDRISRLNWSVEIIASSRSGKMRLMRRWWLVLVETGFWTCVVQIGFPMRRCRVELALCTSATSTRDSGSMQMEMASGCHETDQPSRDTSQHQMLAIVRPLRAYRAYVPWGLCLAIVNLPYAWLMYSKGQAWRLSAGLSNAGQAPKGQSGRLALFPAACPVMDSRDNRSVLSRRRFSRDAFWSCSYSDKTFSLLGCLKGFWASRSTAEGLLDREFSRSFVSTRSKTACAQ